MNNIQIMAPRSTEAIEDKNRSRQTTKCRRKIIPRNEQ